MHRRSVLALLGFGLVLAGLIAANVATPTSPTEYRLAGFTTSLAGRKRAQQRNAITAAQAIDGKRIKPGGVFSYNEYVSANRNPLAYERAPVSVEGTLVPALGGGVCQTSSTLYNAALLAGLTVLERHPHTVAPHYVPPGRDAAVAWPGVDLRLQNPYPFAVRLQATVVGTRLQISVLGERPLPAAVTLETQVLSVNAPTVRHVPGARPAKGTAGVRVATYRCTGTHREALSDNTYATVDSVSP